MNFNKQDIVFVVIVLFGTILIVFARNLLGADKTQRAPVLDGNDNMLLSSKFEVFVRVLYDMRPEEISKLASEKLMLFSVAGAASCSASFLQNLKTIGFYNQQLFDFLSLCQSISFGDGDKTICVDALEVVNRADGKYLLFGHDSTGEFQFGIKQFDDRTVYELVGKLEVDSLGTFDQFILLRYFYEHSEYLTVTQALSMLGNKLNRDVHED